MTQTTDSPKIEDAPRAAPGSKPGWLVWLVLALWFAWLAALAVLSYPEWGKSKVELLSPPDHEN